MSEQEVATSPEMTIWQTATDMNGSQFGRKSYYVLLRDGSAETRFIFRLHADGRIEAEPYVVHEYDYDYLYDNSDDDEEDEEDFYDDIDDGDDEDEEA